jgi:hypothetical protein
MDHVFRAINLPRQRICQQRHGTHIHISPIARQMLMVEANNLAIGFMAPTIRECLSRSHFGERRCPRPSIINILGPLWPRRSLSGFLAILLAYVVKQSGHCLCSIGKPSVFSSMSRPFRESRFWGG